MSWARPINRVEHEAKGKEEGLKRKGRKDGDAMSARSFSSRALRLHLCALCVLKFFAHADEIRSVSAPHALSCHTIWRMRQMASDKTGQDI